MVIGYLILIDSGIKVHLFGREGLKSVDSELLLQAFKASRKESGYYSER